MNVPNALSVFRILLVPVFISVFFSGAENARLFAALVYAIAAVSDILDGFIARRFHLTTKLGRILDPLADKLMAFTVIVCIAWAKIVPVWAVIIFFIKEALMGVGALVLYKKTWDVIPADNFGKVATIIFFIICIILMVFDSIPKTVATTMISIALAVMVVAFINYLKKFISISGSRK